MTRLGLSNLGFVHTLAHLLSDILNPLFALLWLGALIALRGRPGLGVWAFRSVLGLAIAVILAELGKRHQIWRGHPAFPSGHETFGSSVATSLALLDRRWAPAVVILCVLLAWALVTAGYHDWVEVTAAAVLGPSITTLAHRIRRQTITRGDDQP